jgi:hypothetical protein
VPSNFASTLPASPFSAAASTVLFCSLAQKGVRPFLNDQPRGRAEAGHYEGDMLVIDTVGFNEPTEIWR